MKKIETNDEKARESILVGINTAVNLIKKTFGYHGLLAILRSMRRDERGNTFPNWKFTKDGYSVAMDIFFDDHEQDTGASMIKSACQATVDTAGDGTTLTAILCQALMNAIHEAILKGSNRRELKKGIDEAAELIIAQIKKYRTEVVKDGVINYDLVREIAMIASNSDEEIGGISAEAIQKTNNGMITVEPSPDNNTTITTVDGVLLAGTLTSNYFITNVEKQRCELENCYIVIYDRVLNEFNDIKPLLSQFVEAQNKEVSIAQKTGRDASRLSLLIICHDCTGTALELIITNKQQGSLNVGVVKMKDHGVTRRNIMEDIAMVTNGDFLSEEKGQKLAKVKFSQLGYAKKVIINREDTIIIPEELESIKEYLAETKVIPNVSTFTEFLRLNGETRIVTEEETKFLNHKSKVRNYLSTLKSQIEAEENPIEKKIAETRYAYLTSGVAVIRVGGKTADEVKEKTDRVDDAICASRSAIKEGIVAGGGSLFLKLSTLIENMKYKTESERAGQIILMNALQEPFRQLLLNAGIPTEFDIKRTIKIFNKPCFAFKISNTSSILNKVKTDKDYSMGYNLKTDKYENLLQAGVIDSAMVVRVALENSVASATLFTLLGGICAPNH